MQVHQIELETQNEELRRTQNDLAAARDRYIDLYDFAPVGYLTLDREGLIVEANLTGAALLGVERKALLGRRFSRFVAATHGDRWHHQLQKAVQHDEAQRIELALNRPAGGVFHAQLDCLRVAPPGAEPRLRVTLTDVSQRKLAETNRRIADSTVDAREAERRRVARELHEDLGQRLSALKMDLASLQNSADPKARDQRVGSMLETLDDAVATVRRIATELRPMMLDDLGLNAAVDWLARDSARRLGLDITLHLDDTDPSLGDRSAVAMYRMLQETLDYLARQLHATSLHIEMHQQRGEVVLSVKCDDGGRSALGATAEEQGETQVLRDHAHQLGGRLVFDEPPEGGQRITVRLPLARSVSDDPTHAKAGWP